MNRIVLPALMAAVMATASYADPLKIGFMNPSVITDVGWAKQLDLGREAIENAFGDRVQVTVVENILEGPDAARVMNQLVADGNTFLILGTFGYMNDGLKIAAANPDVDIIHASGYQQTANFGTFTPRTYEGFYLAGMAAGMATKSDTIGIVASFAIPEVIAAVNATTLAIHKTNPDASVKLIWVNSWFDPPKEQEAARALVAQGADVIFSLYQDTPSLVNVAVAENVQVVATGSDMTSYGPQNVLASVTFDWSGYFVDQVQAALDGTFVGADVRGGLSDGMVKVAGWGPTLSDAQKAEIAAVEAAIKSGTTSVFAGPITDQAGTLRVAEGATLADPEIFGMDWLVADVQGNLPN
jgi:basic membrane protein A and related proteins